MRRTAKYATALMAGLMMTVWGGISALAGEWNFTGPESWKWEYRDDNGSRAGAGWKEIDELFSATTRKKPDSSQ